MGILGNLPHTASAKIRSTAVDQFGGQFETLTTVFTGKKCWQQFTTEGESNEFGREGFRVTCKVYFQEDPGITKEHVVTITNSQAPNPEEYDVLSAAKPDGTVGLGVFWRVLLGRRTTDA